MMTGSLSYGSYIDGVEFQKVEYASNSPQVQRVELLSVRGDITIVVYVADVADYSEAQAIGLREANRAVNILTIEQGMYVSEPAFKQSSLRDSISGFEQMYVPLGTADLRLGAWSLTGPPSGILKAALANSTPPGECDYQLFRTILATNDVASKFLALYRMLGHLARSDSQKDIDNLIDRHGGGFGSGNTGRSGKRETIYTKIRNDYMHTDRLVPLSSVRIDMEKHITSLIRLVQEAIRNP